MARHYGVAELQLTQAGTIANIVTDHGTDQAAAMSHYHSALASTAVGQLVAGAAVLVVFDPELTDSAGYGTVEVLKGTQGLNE